jgi:micrococcal nuclease
MPAPPTTESDAQSALVTQVVDGDTIVVQMGKLSQKVRLIGIDAPESVDPKKPDQCYGKESAANATKLLLNQTIKLEADPTQTDTDIYGRLLRYIYLPDGTLVNNFLIEQGDAREYTYKGKSYQFQAQFRATQQQARANQKGLWATGVCHP